MDVPEGPERSFDLLIDEVVGRIHSSALGIVVRVVHAKYMVACGGFASHLAGTDSLPGTLFRRPVLGFHLPKLSRLPDDRDSARPIRQMGFLMDARNHPTVRRGTGWWRRKSWTLTILLSGIGILLLRDPTALNIFGTAACIAGAGLTVYLGEKQVKTLRHEYRYEDDGSTS